MAAWRPRSPSRCSTGGSRRTAPTKPPSSAPPGPHLGTALATVVGALDVTEVVLSGPPDGVATETFRTAAAEAIASRTLPLIGERLVVRPSTLGFDDVIVGAAAGARPGAGHSMITDELSVESA